MKNFEEARENLKGKMRKLALLPPPSIEKVRAQMDASAKWRKEYNEVRMAEKQSKVIIVHRP